MWIDCFSSATYTVIAGDWDKTVDEGTEQTRNAAKIIMVLYKGSYMSLYVLWNLLNDLWKTDKK